MDNCWELHLSTTCLACTFNSLILALTFFSVSGDVNGAFLVLTWGANPDSRDNNGDTPLLWILRNKPLGTGSAAQELIKMLLRFGASPTLDNGTDGNSPLHVLAVTKKPDMKVCFLIYTAAGAVGKSVTNKEGLTAYSVRTISSFMSFSPCLFLICGVYMLLSLCVVGSFTSAPTWKTLSLCSCGCVVNSPRAFAFYVARVTGL
jgi:hypothetical protein